MEDIHIVSSQAYFKTVLDVMVKSPGLSTAIAQNYSNSAGMASESVVFASRKALCDNLTSLPVSAAAENEHEYSLLSFANDLVAALRSNLGADRLLLPLLEVLAFLLDMGILQKLSTTTQFSFRTLFVLVQKAHFKSANVQKLHIALDVYRGLASVDGVRADCLDKVMGMLLHPFPKVRGFAAATLFTVTHDEELKTHDWTASPKVLKAVVERLRSSLNR